MILIRTADSEYGMFGVLIYKGIPFSLTLENPWINNKPFESCIPIGSYECKRYQSQRFGNTFKIMNVSGRSGILLHWGNQDSHTKGCILVGEEFGYIGKNPAILSSKRGFKEFLSKVDDVDDFELIIKNAW